WNCADRPPKYPVFEQDLDQWVIGYQYFGGITNWMNPTGPGGIGKSYSPIKISSSQPHWTLAADMVMKIGGAWGTDDRDIFTGVPPHKGKNNRPLGGNQLFIDGSAEWIKVDQMSFFHCWDGSGASRVAYFYQNPADFTGIFASPNVQRKIGRAHV